MLIHSPDDLASFIANTRKKLKLSQTEIGDRVGLKQQTISQFEIKPENTELDTLFRILSSLDLDVLIVPKKSQKTEIKKQWNEEW